jgi:hypothetical protein
MGGRQRPPAEGRARRSPTCGEGRGHHPGEGRRQGELIAREGPLPTAGNGQRAQTTSLAGRGLKRQALAMRSRGRHRDDKRDTGATAAGPASREGPVQGLRRAPPGGEDGEEQPPAAEQGVCVSSSGHPSSKNRKAPPGGPVEATPPPRQPLEPCSHAPKPRRVQPDPRRGWPHPCQENLSPTGAGQSGPGRKRRGRLAPAASHQRGGQRPPQAADVTHIRRKGQHRRPFPTRRRRKRRG